MSNHSAVTMYPFRQGEKWGLCDQHGNILCEPRYDGAGESDGAVTWLQDESRVLIVDSEIKIVSEIDGYLGVWGFECGLTALRTRDGSGYQIFDTTGCRKSNTVFGQVMSYSENYAIAEVGRKWGLLSDDCEWVLAPQYDRATCYSAADDRMTVYSSEKDICRLIDSTGASHGGRAWKHLSQVNEGLVPWAEKVGDSLRFGLIDIHGDVVISPRFLMTARLVNDGRLPVKSMNEKWGVVDTDGSWVVDPIYTAMDVMSNGRAVFYKGGKLGIDGCLVGGKFGYLDRDGKEVTDAVFDDAYSFRGELAVVAWSRGGDENDYGLINRKGETVYREKVS